MVSDNVCIFSDSVDNMFISRCITSSWNPICSFKSTMLFIEIIQASTVAKVVCWAAKACSIGLADWDLHDGFRVL